MKRYTKQWYSHLDAIKSICLNLSAHDQVAVNDKIRELKDLVDKASETVTVGYNAQEVTL